MTSSLQEQARALGDRTRYEIFRYIAGSDGGVDVAELTTHVGLNHNAVRQHLAKLVEADLVDRATVSSGGRGRPRLVYGVDPAADSRWGVTGPYERLSVLLAEMVRTGDSGLEVGRRSVQRERSTTSIEGDPVGQVADAMARRGFDPAVRRQGQRVELVLRRCPFATAALADPETVCAIHLGIARGLAEVSGGRVAVDELIPHDPRQAHCRLRLHLLSAPDA